MSKEILIAYLQPDYAANLEFDSPTCLTGDPLDRKIDGDNNKHQAIINHPEAEFYSLEDFVEAFNDEFISDLGFIALYKKEEK